MNTEIINLQFFAEGESGSAAEGTQVAADGANALDLAKTTEGGTVPEKTREEKYAEFKSEYKDMFQNDFNSAFGKRFKDMKENEEKLKNYEDELQPLYEKYNVNNPKDLVNAYLGDKSQYLELSAETGNSPEELSAIAQLKAERGRRERIERAEKEKEAAKKRDEAIKNTVKNWGEEEANVRKIHPEFSLKENLANAKFRQALRMGMPMIDIYRSLNFDAIANSIKESAKKAAVEEIKSGQGRPSEVGADATKAVSADMDVNSLTDENIDEILERVRRGEKISFAP